MNKAEFRGKSKWNDNGFFAGDWIEGSYAYKDYSDKHYILVERLYYNRTRSYFVEIEVVPETVRQYTGLKDKNDNKIYDNDIVLTKYGRKCQVVFCSTPSFIGWDLLPIDSDNPAPSEYDLWRRENLEVIGNTYDNPEFIKE